ncbi:hypothetical protein ACFW2S_16815 [Streptomyces sp. NPDC058874]
MDPGLTVPAPPAVTVPFVPPREPWADDRLADDTVARGKTVAVAAFTT